MSASLTSIDRTPKFYQESFLIVRLFADSMFPSRLEEVQGAGQDGGLGREAVDLGKGLHHAPNGAENGRCGFLTGQHGG